MIYLFYFATVLALVFPSQNANKR